MSLSVAQETRLWEQTLTVAKEKNLRRSLIREAAYYFGLTPKEILDRISPMFGRSRREWFAKPRVTEASVTSFYDHSIDYILDDILAWHLWYGLVPLRIRCLR